MSSNYTRQYEAPVKPQNWTGDALRFYRMLIDVLDDIYLKYGRIDEKMIGSALREKINSKADNGTVAEIVLEQGKLNASFTSLSGEVTQLAVDVGGILSRVADVESGLESQIRQTPELISAAVGDIQIGGTNILRNSSLYRADSPIKVTSSSTDYYASNREMYMPCTPGDAYTFQAVTDGIWGNHVANGSNPPVTHLFLYLQTADIPFENPDSYSRAVTLDAGSNYGKTGRGVWTYTVPTDQAYVRIRIRYDIHSDGVTPATVSWWDFKAERGNKATGWSPPEGEDYSKGVLNGSGLRITPDELTMYAARSLDINVLGDGGDAHFGVNGLAVQKINSPSVYAQYQGPGTITVGNYNVAPNGESVFATLGDAFAKLSGKNLPYPVTINFASNTQEAGAQLARVSGDAVIINGNNCTLSGQISLDNVASEVAFNNLQIEFGGAGHVVVAQRCTDVKFVGGAVNGAYPTHDGQNGIYGVTSSIGLVNCALSNCYHAIWLADNSRVYIDACTGNNNLYSIILRTHSSAGVISSRPPGTIHVDASCAHPSVTEAGTSGAVTPPATVENVTLTATNTCTHDGGSWYSGTNVLTQGEKNGGVFKGCIWFDKSAFAGKTIKAAAIRLYRKAGVGKGSSVVVRIGSCMNAMPAAGYNVVIKTEYAEIVGTVGQKEELKAYIPVQAVQELADGTAAGLYIYGSADDYAQFDGFDGEHPPKLLVTYS